MTSGDLELQHRCTRFLSHVRPQKPGAWLRNLARSPWAETPLDAYGTGEAIAALEQRVASLLGKEAAVFLPKGVIAQHAALRTWAERSGRRGVALHPKSHIALDEGSGHERLHGLQSLPLGQDQSPFTLDDLKKLKERPGSVVVELPLRRAGFKLPPWETLSGIAAWCRSEEVRLHFDGARLWGCTPYYQRELAEIAGLADSVYVSLYKELGGLAGCLLAGPADFLAETAAWSGRQGGRLYRAFPYVIAGLEGLETQLPRLPDYVARAHRLAAALSAEADFEVDPDPPQTAAFQLYLPAEAERLMSAVRRLAEEEQIWLANAVLPSDLPGRSKLDIQIRDAAEDLSDEEVVAAFHKVVALAAE